MDDNMTVRFMIESEPKPSADAVAEALGDIALSVDLADGVYSVEFDAAEGDEEDEAALLWQMFCEIGVHFPDAVLAS